MNWYALFKLAQIWNVKSDGSFSSEIYSLYELEYKYSMVKNKPFDGLPQRRENILINLERELKIVIKYIKIPIIKAFEDWLASHAILTPKLWAQKRIELQEEYGDDEERMLNNTIDEYYRYTGEIGDITFFITDIMENIDNIPSFKYCIELMDKDYRDGLRNELSDDGIIEFGRNNGKQFKESK